MSVGLSLVGVVLILQISVRASGQVLSMAPFVGFRVQRQKQWLRRPPQRRPHIVKIDFG